MKTLKKVQSLLFVLLSPMFLVGCMINDNEMPEPVPVSHMSIYHAAPNTSGLDIFIDHLKANSQPFVYMNFSGYNSFYTGERNFKFTPSNASTTLTDTTLSLKEDKIYSLFLVNQANNVKQFITEDVWTVPTSGKAMIRLIHLSPDAPTVELTIDDNTESFFNNQNYKSASAFKEIASGTKNLTIKTAGDNNVVATLPEIVIQEKRIYTIILRGYITTPSGNSNSIGMQLMTNHTII